MPEVRLRSVELGQKLSALGAMNLAIFEARKGAGFVSPNPQVGCVILDKNHGFLSKGFHKIWGGPHAEVNALSGLSPQQLKGAIVYVTLEPCAHEGKTPACAKLLARLPIAKVVYGITDPNPLVSGQGARIISQAGITVEKFSELQAELEQVCEHFLINFREKRCFVSVKVAASLDGQMGLKSGESQWITGEGARQKAHRLRAEHEVILVGKNTLLHDNSRLNIRHPRFADKQNKVVILDSQAVGLRRPDLAVFSAHRRDQILYFVDESVEITSQMQAHAQVYRVSSLHSGQLDLGLILSKLWELGVKSLLVEGGGSILKSFISQQRADRLYLFQAPILLGANSGMPWSEGVNIGRMSEKLRLRSPQLQRLGSDILITGRLK